MIYGIPILVESASEPLRSIIFIFILAVSVQKSPKMELDHVPQAMIPP